MSWVNTSGIGSRDWTCGYCGKIVGGKTGYRREQLSCSTRFDRSKIYICPRCERPTAFIVSDDGGVEQVPGPMEGAAIHGLPETVSALYDEIRKCVQAGAYTSAVLSSRKMLMHIAVDNGAEEGQTFARYVGWLNDAHYIPPNGAEWVDEVRKRSNEQNHEIVLASREDAMQLLDFIEMLLRFCYEFPSRVRRK